MPSHHQVFLMSTGVLLSLAGYVLLAYAWNVPVALFACGALIGTGSALFAALPPAILAGGWFPHARGRVTGIAYLPLFSTILPVLAVSILQRHGLKGLFLALALFHVLLLPLMLGVMDPALDVAQDQAADIPNVETRPGGIMGTTIFWLILLGDGLLSGTSIAGSAHLLPAVTEHGISMELGAELLGISGIASIAGSLLAGIACDRWGSANTLGLAGLGFASGWGLMAFTGWPPALAVSAALIGLGGAAVFPPLNALSAEVFGVEALPKVLGLFGLLTIPITFAMSPLSGWLRDLVGNYRPVCAEIVAGCGAAALIFFGIGRHLRRSFESGKRTGLT